MDNFLHKMEYEYTMITFHEKQKQSKTNHIYSFIQIFQTLKKATQIHKKSNQKFAFFSILEYT